MSSSLEPASSGKSVTPSREGRHKASSSILAGVPKLAPAVGLSCGVLLGAGLLFQGPPVQHQPAPGAATTVSPASVTASPSVHLSFDRTSTLFSQPGSGWKAGGSAGQGWGAGGFPGSGWGAEGVPGSGWGSVGGYGQPASAVNGDLSAVVQYAYAGLGHPYVWGGTSFANGWDCSGFVQWAYAQAGIALPRVSQWEALTPTTTPSPGDLVTQRPDGPNHWAHVGIYVGNGMMISALNPQQGTILHSVGPPGTSWFFTTNVSAGPESPDSLPAPWQPPVQASAPQQGGPPEAPTVGDSKDQNNASDPKRDKDPAPKRDDEPRTKRDSAPAPKHKDTSPRNDPPAQASLRPAPEQERTGGGDRHDRHGENDTQQDEDRQPEQSNESHLDSGEDDRGQEQDQEQHPKPSPALPTDGADNPDDQGGGDNSDVEEGAAADKSETDPSDTTTPTEEDPPATEEQPTDESTAEESTEEASSDDGPTKSEQPTDESKLPETPTATDEPTPEPTNTDAEAETNEPTTDSPNSTDEPTTKPSPEDSSTASEPPTVNPLAAVEAAQSQVGQALDPAAFIETVLLSAGYQPTEIPDTYLKLGKSVDSVNGLFPGDLLFYPAAEDGSLRVAVYVGVDETGAGKAVWASPAGKVAEFTVAEHEAELVQVNRLESPQ
ncbi:NlpC/P60 family protein [Arthrobacter castelli]|uniref:NlpC/P60 family protein n=1 Tax=Arthrobacter castelli TaxID=271431 RepID=UPI00040AC022|nr:NlpC/P60 family protein [Arthrobacter castelli]